MLWLPDKHSDELGIQNYCFLLQVAWKDKEEFHIFPREFDITHRVTLVGKITLDISLCAWISN
jgi:hypothetical protein